MESKYICPIDIDCTTLDASTVYYSFFNNNTHNLVIDEINMQTMSETGSGNSKSMFAFARYLGASAPSGGTTINYTKMDTSSPNITVDIRKSNTGLTYTGTISPYFLEVAIRTGDGGIFTSYDFDDGIVLSPTQGIVILADGPMVGGASLHGSIEFSTKH